MRGSELRWQRRSARPRPSTGETSLRINAVLCLWHLSGCARLAVMVVSPTHHMATGFRHGLPPSLECLRSPMAGPCPRCYLLRCRDDRIPVALAECARAQHMQYLANLELASLLEGPDTDTVAKLKAALGILPHESSGQ